MKLESDEQGMISGDDVFFSPKEMWQFVTANITVSLSC
jgi:hypothetical protein